MLKSNLTYLFLLIALITKAQLNLDWVNCTDANITNSSNIILDNNNNSYSTNNASQIDSIAFIRKVDKNGILIFQKNIFSKGLIISDISLDQNNNIYIGGYFIFESVFDSLLPNATISNGSMFIAKYDSTGNFKWVIELGDNSDYMFGLCIINDRINTVGRIGGTCDLDPGSNYVGLSNCAFIAQYDLDANFISANRIRKKYAQSDAIAYAISHDSENNVIISGTYEKSVDLDFSSDTAYTLNTEAGIFVAKYDIELNLLWVKSSYITSFGTIPDITTDIQGNIIFNCYISAPSNFDPLGLDGTIEGIDDYHVVGKYDQSGNLMWIKTVAMDEFMGWGKNVCTDNVGNVYFTGYYGGQLDFDSGFGGIITSSSTDIFITKYDPNGNYIWAQSIGGIGGQTGLGVICDNNNSLYLTGTYYNSADFDLGPDSTSFIPQSNSSFVAKYGTELTGIGETTKYGFIKIYPNPANDYISIDIEKPCTISIINAMGQTVLTQKLTMGLNRIDTSSLPDGLFYYSLTGKEYLSNGKFIIAK